VSEAVETIRVANRFYEARRGSYIVSQIVPIEGQVESQGSAGRAQKMKVGPYLRPALCCACLHVQYIRVVNCLTVNL
jgi:hypothetical protein